jgi:hypothetical protein
MAKRGDILFWMFFIGLYAFAFSMGPFSNYTTWLRTGTPPDPVLVARARDYETAYYACFGLYFAVVCLVWFGSYFQTWKLANRYPRVNVKLVYSSRFHKMHLGMGIVGKPFEVKNSSIDIEDALRSAGLLKVFEEIKVEVTQKFSGKRVAEDLNPKNPKDDKDKKKTYKKVSFEVEDLKKEDVNFESFPIEILHRADLANFFDKDEIKFLKDIGGINNEKEFMDKTTAELDILKSKYFTKLNRHRDLIQVKVYMSKCLGYLNLDQINFLKAMNINTFLDLLNADLENLNARYNDKFIKPATSFTEKFMKVFQDMISNNNINFKNIVRYMVEDLIAQEKHFSLEIDKQEYIKFINVKVQKVKAMFPDKHAYIVQWDSPFEIPSSMPELDFYKSREIEEQVQEIEEIDETNNFVPVKTTLLLTPVSLNDCCTFSPGEIEDFNGHRVDCSQVTDMIVRYRGMVTADMCIIEIRACDWTVNHQAPVTVDWADKEVFDIKMATMIQLVEDERMMTEDTKKLLEVEKQRVQKKNKELKQMWAKKWADTTPDVITRKLTVTPHPLNVFTHVIIAVIFVAAITIGIFIGFLMYPWIMSMISPTPSYSNLIENITQLII